MPCINSQAWSVEGAWCGRLLGRVLAGAFLGRGGGQVGAVHPQAWAKLDIRFPEDF